MNNNTKFCPTSTSSFWDRIKREQNPQYPSSGYGGSYGSYGSSSSYGSSQFGNQSTYYVPNITGIQYCNSSDLGYCTKR